MCLCTRCAPAVVRTCLVFDLAAPSRNGSHLEENKWEGGGGPAWRSACRRRAVAATGSAQPAGRARLRPGRNPLPYLPPSPLPPAQDPRNPAAVDSAQRLLGGRHSCACAGLDASVHEKAYGQMEPGQPRALRKPPLPPPLPMPPPRRPHRPHGLFTEGALVWCYLSCPLALPLSL